MLKNKRFAIILLSVTAVLIGMFAYNEGVLQGENSFEINSEPHEIDLVDYAQDGQFILHGDYIYYAGEKGAVYKAPIDNLQNNKKIYEIKDYGFINFFKRGDDHLFLMFHEGNASMGSTYEAEIYANDKISEPKSVGFGVPSVGETKSGYALDWSADGQPGNITYGYKIPRYETDNYDYVVAYRFDVQDDLSRIYKLNKNTEEMTQISEIPTVNLKYRDGKIYFVGNDNKLYSFKVGEDIVSVASNGPIDYQGIEVYEVLNDSVYYINMDDQKVYNAGNPEAINSGLKGISINLIDNLLFLRFESVKANSYSTVFVDETGKEMLSVAAFISIVSADSGRIVYYEDTVNKIYIVKY